MPTLKVASFWRKSGSHWRKRRMAGYRRPSFESLEERNLLSGSGMEVQPGITLFTMNILDLDPMYITAGLDGAIWFNGMLSNKLGRITTSGDITEYPSLDSVTITDLAPGKDGAIWFTDSFAGHVGRVSTDGSLSVFPVKDTQGNSPDLQTIVQGVDGNVWFSSRFQIGTISSSGSVSWFQQTTQGEIGSLTSGPDGNMWFTEPQSHIVGKVSPSGAMTEYTIDSILNGHPMLPMIITTGQDGNLWFTGMSGNRLGKITPGGELTIFSLPENLQPRSIAAGPDGSLWFTSGASVGRITTGGVVSQFSVAADVSDFAITAGPDGNLWFDTNSRSPSSGSYYIGRMNPAALGNGEGVVVSASQGKTFTTTLANISLPTSEGATVRIDWGDGHSSPGALLPDGHGGYLVTGTEAYSASGNFSISITVTTSEGLALTIPTTARVAADPNAVFVSGLYQQILGRAAEAGGSAHWTAQLNNGASRGQIAIQIENSLESRQRLVDQLYVHYLGRHADTDGMIAFSTMLTTGGSLERVQALILSSPEFFARAGGTPAGFLNELYQGALSRKIDADAFLALNQELSFFPSVVTRLQIALGVVTSAEAVKLQVQSAYLSILNRSTETAGLAFWTQFRADGNSETVVRAGLLGSDEFFALAQSR